MLNWRFAYTAGEVVQRWCMINFVSYDFGCRKNAFDGSHTPI